MDVTIDSSKNRVPLFTFVCAHNKSAQTKTNHDKNRRLNFRKWWKAGPITVCLRPGRIYNLLGNLPPDDQHDRSSGFVLHCTPLMPRHVTMDTARVGSAPVPDQIDNEGEGEDVVDLEASATGLVDTVVGNGADEVHL